MASQTHTIPVLIETNDGRHAEGEATLVSLDAADRNQRALKWLGILWGIAICSIPLPLIHFFFVPGFFIAGPIVALIMRNRANLIQGGSALCPNCGQKFPIVSGAEQWPLRDLCSNCRAEVKIMPKTA